ncbi:MAG: ABC transporter permease [Alphaproteobacteria bacterium]
MAAAAATQGRVVQALMLREIKSRFGRLKLGYLWAVFEPAAFVALFAVIFALAHQTAPSGMPVVLFMMTGIGPFMLFRNTMNQTMNAIETNRVLLTFPQVKLIDLVLARALLEIATHTVVFFLLLAAVHALGFAVRIENPLLVLAALACLALTGFGLGAAFASLVPFFRSVPQIVSIVAGRPLFFTSGLFFTAEMMPAGIREFLLLNPILVMIEWLRSAFFVEFESRYVSVEYALGTTLFTVFLGLLMLRGLRKHILAAV